MPAGVEQRAKSFAGELLLPTDVAAEFWHRANRPSDRVGLDRIVRDIIGTYGVIRSVEAWKIEHAARRQSVDLGAVLEFCRAALIARTGLRCWHRSDGSCENAAQSRSSSPSRRITE